MFKHKCKIFLNNLYVLYKSMTYDCGVYAYKVPFDADFAVAHDVSLTV